MGASDIIKPSKRDTTKADISEGYLSKRTILQVFDQVKNNRQQEVSPMDSVISVIHQYVSGTADAGSCEERDLCFR